MDITELKHELARSVGGVAQHLLPNGRREGSEWRCGSTSGEAGKSLGVHLSGEKAGVWSDFGASEGGDLLDLWVATQGISLREAITEAKNYLGIHEPQFDKPRTKAWVRPQKPRCQAPQSKVLSYLLDVRKLTSDAIEAYKIGEDGENIIFPFMHGNELVMAKYRPAIDGGTPKPTTAGCKPVLFGWQAIPEDARSVTITEGEIDAMSMWDYGFPALSLPFGGGKGAKHAWIDHEYHRLDQFETIYLALDSDGPGQEATAEIADRLGKHRCRIVKLPYKDANECRQKNVSVAQIEGAFHLSAYLSPEELRGVEEYADEVSELFFPEENSKSIGYDLPWDKFKDLIKFRPGEVTHNC